ncbi:MAG: DUF3560 domain-containing protein [Desulfobacterales bacterium]|jgi:predicted RNA methylase|nr:DUF3560 domain-containing protein [Desulfobacterales bacterium]
MDHTATYSPDDNSLRLYPAYRLDKEDYNRVKAAGFKWAPKQELFVAHMWTPHREDLLIEMCGEIGDEDTGLVERAEERADRFSDYSSNRAADAESARKQVSAIADNIPLGQPILVGHHSEKHARKHAEKIENGMRKAVKMWETSKYWKSRAAGALRHAKYKERPDVRARRIKKIEADKRASERTKNNAEKYLAAWTDPDKELTLDRALALSDISYSSFKFPLAEYPREPPVSQYEGDMGLWSALDGKIITPEQARDLIVPAYRNTINFCDRWLSHYENRLIYERAMLEEQGGLKADAFDFQIGGQVKHRWGWNVIKKINRKDGVITSLSLFSKSYPTKVNVEEVQDYTPPAEADIEKVKAVTKLPPMCNYETEKCAVMTQAEFKAVYQDHKSSAVVNQPGVERHRIRVVDGFIGRKHGAVTEKQWGWVKVFISDAKVKHPAAEILKPAVEIPAAKMENARKPTGHYSEPEKTIFDDMKDALRNGGVRVVSAPQLFPTPLEIAKKMVEAADIRGEHRVLEPSAGTGNLLKAIGSAPEKVAVEINHAAVEALARCGVSGLHIVHDDFLKCTPETLGRFDRVIMNPPFANGEDIKHILHALQFLFNNSRLIALCANGPRQREKLIPLAEESGGYWLDLPTGSFASAGTNVNVAMLVIEN